MGPIIELKDVWKIFKMGDTEVQAVRGVSLTIDDGEFVAIQGPSGSGKSTMMNLVGCLDYPTKGHIFLKGKDITTLPESGLAQIRGKTIGFVFQKFNLLPSLTAIENVSLPLMFQGIPREKRYNTAKKILHKMGLGDRLEHKPNQLSGGEQQRVAIARALSINPEVILADEPTGNLDSERGKRIIHILKNLNEQGKTVVMVTHEDNLARHAKRIIRLKDGQVLTTEKVKQ